MTFLRSHSSFLLPQTMSLPHPLVHGCNPHSPERVLFLPESAKIDLGYKPSLGKGTERDRALAHNELPWISGNCKKRKKKIMTLKLVTGSPIRGLDLLGEARLALIGKARCPPPPPSPPSDRPVLPWGQHLRGSSQGSSPGLLQVPPRIRS